MKGKIETILGWLSYIGLVVMGIAALAAVVVLILLGIVKFAEIISLRPADDLPPAEPADGVAWIMPEAGEVPVWMAPACAENEMAAYMLDTYTEGDGPAPEWYRPDEPMSAEWADGNALQSDAVDYIAHPPIGIDPGGMDWNIETEMVGWDGHRMAIWEMDLFSRIVFLEFGITSPECREAGIDAILRLWESGYYSSTMFGTLSAVAENGKPAFSTYPGVWEEEYDYEKLARFREECEERFVNGPEWTAPFFRTGHYHEWAVPMYEIDGVYFSTGKGW